VNLEELSWMETEQTDDHKIWGPSDIPEKQLTIYGEKIKLQRK
jgi:hypothetical protein